MTEILESKTETAHKMWSDKKSRVRCRMKIYKAFLRTSEYGSSGNYQDQNYHREYPFLSTDDHDYFWSTMQSSLLHTLLYMLV